MESLCRFAAPADGRLEAPLLAAWEEYGLLVLEGFASRSECARLMQRAQELVESFQPAEVASIFSTTRQAELTDRYFLESGDEVRFFFEEGAFSPEGTLRQPKELALNKIGHALHDLDPVFAAFSRQPRLARLVAELGLVQPRLMQSMYIFKQPRIGGEVVCHQDGTFLLTEPCSVVGLWVALEDATLENGCMWALPGGHRGGLKRRFVRAPGGGVRLEVVDPEPWPEFREAAPYVPLEVGAGTLVVLHGLLPHLSGANRSERSRHAYSVHVVEGTLPWLADNWLQRRPERPARGF